MLLHVFLFLCTLCTSLDRSVCCSVTTLSDNRQPSNFRTFEPSNTSMLAMSSSLDISGLTEAFARLSTHTPAPQPGKSSSSETPSLSDSPVNTPSDSAPATPSTSDDEIKVGIFHWPRFCIDVPTSRPRLTSISQTHDEPLPRRSTSGSPAPRPWSGTSPRATSRLLVRRFRPFLTRSLPQPRACQKYVIPRIDADTVP